MLRIIVEGLNSVAVRDVGVPVPRRGEALVRMTLAGICGSDTHAVAGLHPLLKPPYAPGHEAVGVLMESAGEFPKGTRVILKPNVPCGRCVNCVHERDNACQELSWVGCDPSGYRPGAMSEYFCAPVANLHRLPDDATEAQGVLVECFSTPIHAARVAGDLRGSKVVVLGAGTIGALMVIAARQAGASRIVVTDLDHAKLSRAIRLGADAGVLGSRSDVAASVVAELGDRADVLFDCVAIQGSASLWPLLVRRAATICVVGVPNGDYSLPMPAIQDWELRVQGCAAYSESDFRKAVTFASSIPADELITEIMPLALGREAFASASSLKTGKVVVSSGEK